MNILHHNFQYDYHNKKILPFNFVTCAVLDILIEISKKKDII